MKPPAWPCHPSELSNAAEMPTQLHRFHPVFWSRPNICSQHKPPKHVLLPYAVKTLTGNTEIIRILNKYGHGMSYTQLEENDTALCLQKLASGVEENVSHPASIKPHVFTNLAWDNIDRIEETLSGKEPSHRVNGIVV